LPVRNDHIGLVEGDHLRGPPVHLDHPADVGHVAVVLNPIVDLEGVFGVDRQSCKNVSERVLEGKAEHGGDHRGARKQVTRPHSRLVKNRHKRRGHHEPAKHIKKDFGHRGANPLPHRHPKEQ
jgi:hypothetical protein